MEPPAEKPFDWADVFISANKVLQLMENSLFLVTNMNLKRWLSTCDQSLKKLEGQETSRFRDTVHRVSGVECCYNVLILPSLQSEDLAASFIEYGSFADTLDHLQRQRISGYFNEFGEKILSFSDLIRLHKKHQKDSHRCVFQRETSGETIQLNHPLYYPVPVRVGTKGALMMADARHWDTCGDVAVSARLIPIFLLTVLRGAPRNGRLLDIIDKLREVFDTAVGYYGRADMMLVLLSQFCFKFLPPTICFPIFPIRWLLCQFFKEHCRLLDMKLFSFYLENEVQQLPSVKVPQLDELLQEMVKLGKKPSVDCQGIFDLKTQENAIQHNFNAKRQDVEWVKRYYEHCLFDPAVISYCYDATVDRDARSFYKEFEIVYEESTGLKMKDYVIDTLRASIPKTGETLEQTQRRAFSFIGNMMENVHEYATQQLHQMERESLEAPPPRKSPGGSKKANKKRAHRMARQAADCHFCLCDVPKTDFVSSMCGCRAYCKSCVNSQPTLLDRCPFNEDH